jgi:hypothetical protein
MHTDRNSLSKRAIASVSALALLTVSIAPLSLPRSAAAAEAGPPISAGAAKPATQPPANANKPQAEAGEKPENLVTGIKKHAASVGMLLLLLAAAPGNLARNVDQAIQKADFGKKPGEAKAGDEKGSSPNVPGGPR